MGPKDSFGEQALYEKSTRGASVRAESEVRCLAFRKRQFNQNFRRKSSINYFQQYYEMES